MDSPWAAAGKEHNLLEYQTYRVSRNINKDEGEKETGKKNI
jgi:hypothetical protein